MFLETKYHRFVVLLVGLEIKVNNLFSYNTYIHKFWIDDTDVYYCIIWVWRWGTIIQSYYCWLRHSLLLNVGELFEHF